MSCPRLKKILELINIPYIDDYDKLSIDRIAVDVTLSKSDVYLTVKEYVDATTYFSLYTNLKGNFSLTGLGDSCQIIVNFLDKNFDSAKVEEYYKVILERFTSSKPRYLALNNYKVIFDDNQVTVLTGNVQEQAMIQELLNTITRGFESLGLNFIELKTIVSDLITPVAKEIEISIDTSITNKLKEQRVYESDIKKAKESSEYTNPKKPRKMSTPINEPPVPIGTLPTVEHQIATLVQTKGTAQVVVQGEITSCNFREIRNDLLLYSCFMTDGTGTISVKGFINKNDKGRVDFFKKEAIVGNVFKVFGILEYDSFARDVIIKFRDVLSYGPAKKQTKTDDAPEKRVELHAHSKMTVLDSTLDVEAYVDRALEYGHRAVAITDKNNVQALPQLEHYLQKLRGKGKALDFKPIYGIEGNLVDEKDFNITFTTADINLTDATFVVYDLETTGIQANYTEIIEIAACKVRNGVIIDEFDTYVNPRKEIPEKITELTSITNDDVRNAPYIEEALENFRNFYSGCIMVAQNASFDNSHLYRNLKKIGYTDKNLPTIDTLQLARVKYNTKLKKFNLDALCKLFGVTLENHHRAIYDARATAEVFIKMYWDLINDGIRNYNQINSLIDFNEAYKYIFPTHVTLLAKNRKGLVNINKIVSESHTTNFYREPRILKKFLSEHREGLLVGSSCYNGEVFDTAICRSYEELLDVVSFYDYLEVQPVEVYSHLIESSSGEVNEDSLREVIRKIIRAGREKGIMVVATGDVHHLDANDNVYRKMLLEKPMIGGGFHELHSIKELPKQHFRSTEEMLKEFKFLGEELAYEIVVTNSNYIADQIEVFDLFPRNLFSPGDDFYKAHGVPSVKVAVREQTYQTAHAKYGPNLPQLVTDRIEQELKGILDNGYAPVYYISYLLVKHSKDAGYVVGSRGSVGSSVVAAFMGITEVNALPPHYVCPHCYFSAFKLTPEQKKKYTQTQEQQSLEAELQSVSSGYDLPLKKCPICGCDMTSDGCEIPFETFMGFSGEKLPDIDLNFSGEYQARAHAFCREVFGVKNTYRGGTVGTIAEQTAFGYVKGYYERQGKLPRHCEIEQMTPKLINVKRTTGQHPGGIIVVPDDIDINEITPVQYPADDTSLEWKTTHHGYHDFEKNLLKLDILGHDDPTMIRHLMNFVEANPENYPFKNVEDIPINDEKIVKLFSSVEPLNVSPDRVLMQVGTTGLPEFGTSLTKDMLCEIRPKQIADLIKISGLSHGTGVWQGNARDYFLGLKPNVPKIPFNELIGCRDDIMVRLSSKGIEARQAFLIMEKVRKGKPLTDDDINLMRKNNVEEWFIDSCKIIEYLFPKAHATAYVIMALRIAWFKIYKPIQYYSGFFSKRAKAYDVEIMAGGYDSILSKIKELTAVDEKTNKKKELSVKESDLYNSLLLALEMTARGFKFRQIDIAKSHAVDFIVEGDDTLLIPFVAMDALGESTARSITDARDKYAFTSKKDVVRRTRINSTLLENLSRLGAFGDLPDDDQIGLFSNNYK